VLHRIPCIYKCTIPWLASAKTYIICVWFILVQPKQRKNPTNLAIVVSKLYLTKWTFIWFSLAEIYIHFFSNFSCLSDGTVALVHKIHLCFLFIFLKFYILRLIRVIIKCLWFLAAMALIWYFRAPSIYMVVPVFFSAVHGVYGTILFLRFLHSAQAISTQFFYMITKHFFTRFLSWVLLSIGIPDVIFVFHLLASTESMEPNLV
jgi:hypothetical protein